jgi:GTP-binding protein Era
LRSAFVGIVGRPSSGKSTLLNALCGAKVSIVSPVPQTTRNRIRGILNFPDGQLVLVDTPGYHLSTRKLNLHLRQLTLSALKEADLVLYVIDSSRPPGPEEMALMKLLSPWQGRVVIALNKIDQPGHGAAALENELSARFQKAPVLKLSARTGEGLKALKEALLALAPPGERLYPPEFYTDQTPELRIREILREQAFKQIHGELPHCLYVEIEDLEMREGGERLWVRAFLYTERDSQKGILVGRDGEKIRTIVRNAEAELAEIFPYAVHLDVRVKVKPKWRRDSNLLKRLMS